MLNLIGGPVLRALHCEDYQSRYEAHPWMKHPFWA